MGQRKKKTQGQAAHLVFVYGSLKEGFPNNTILGRHARKVGSGLTRDAKYEMFSLGGFPTVYSVGNQRIKGEVWAVTDSGLQDCDILEGHPHLYTRSLQKIKLDSGRIMTAWMYLMSESDRGRYVGRPNHNRVQLTESNGETIANWSK